MDESLIKRAKLEAKRRKKSLSLMVSEYLDTLDSSVAESENIPPITASLRGIIKGKSVSEEDYKKHLVEKYG